MRSLVATTALVLALLLGPAALAKDAPTTPEGAGDLVDRVVATANGTPITASDVALEAAIRERIAASPRKEEFGRLLTEQVEPLEAVIFRTILRGQPDARTVRPSGSKAELRLRLFEESFGSREAALQWRIDWGLEKSALLDWFKESVVLDAVVELAVDFKVTEEQERAYYEAHRDQVYGGRPWEEVSADVARRVYALEFEDEYNSWRKALRSQASLRYIGR
jgi:hypothetical protein